MAWNQPGKKGPDRDPWGSSNDKGSDSRGPKGGREQGPPDLDDVFRKLSQKLSSVGGGKKSHNNDGQNPPANSGFIFGIAIVVALVIWGISGFYTVKETERGVVTRFGKFDREVGSGLNWKPTFIDDVRVVNVESVRELGTSGMMLTTDENVVRVEMNVQYRVNDPKLYLFSVTSADNSLRQATDSALRGVIGRSNMDRVLTEGRTVVRSETQREIEETIRAYNMGITILDVNFQTARPPDEVKEAFDDAIAARENREQYVREAEAYANEAQHLSRGKAQRILEDARAYKAMTVSKAEGEVGRFSRILNEYKKAPEITRERLYIETMERVLGDTRKVLVNDKGNNLMMLPLDQLMRGGTSKQTNNRSVNQEKAQNPLQLPAFSYNQQPKASQSESSSVEDVMKQRRANASRYDSQRQGRE